jgi:hypothetical protein
MRAPDPAQKPPPWEDKSAVAKWVIATWISESEQAAKAYEQERRTWSPEQKKPYEPKWNADFARWRKEVFELARQGRFDHLAQYIAIAYLGDMTIDERKVITDFMTAKIKRGKGRPKEMSPRNMRVSTVSLQRLIGLAEEIRALLIKYYGRHVLHVVERASDRGRVHRLARRVAGDDAQEGSCRA